MGLKRKPVPEAKPGPDNRDWYDWVPQAIRDMPYPYPPEGIQDGSAVAWGAVHALDLSELQRRMVDRIYESLAIPSVLLRPGAYRLLNSGVVRRTDGTET